MTDPMSGMVYLRNRWYSPQLGRFVSRDPIRYDGGDYNLNRFVRNRVQQYSDPSGLMWTTGDFFNHYLNGDGVPVNLSDVGVLGGFKALSGTRSLASKVHSSIDAGQTRGQDNATVDAIDYVWSLGDVALKVTWGCKKERCCSSGKEGKRYDCKLFFWIDEWFADPLDLHDIWRKISGAPKENERRIFWNPEGHPYQIIGEWTEDYKTGCKDGQ